MAHQAETHSPARSPLSADPARRKKVILLCSEELRFVACGLEEALRSRGWNVCAEFGRDARPWIQQTPVERPSLRVLCIPGSVDRELADKLRAAYRPEPDADLHILGVDDSRGLVQEVERLAGVRTLGRRPLSAAPRLAHPTLVESTVRSDRGWRIGAAAAVAAFALVIGGGMLARGGDSGIRTSVLPAGMGSAITQPVTQEPAPSSAQARADATVFSNLRPYDFEEAYELDPLPEEEEELIIILEDDEPELDAPVERVSIGAPSGLPSTSVTTPLELGEAPVTDKSGIELPRGFLPVAGLGVAEPGPQLPAGFLPVAGLSVRPGEDPVSLGGLVAVVTVDPFTEEGPVTASDPSEVATVDPFVSLSDVSAP
ncbi:MAG: hypothetical protein H6712_11105 [Myxococcales bacterium]|nr:hypothetical protein [Myxococcales bacterium]